MFVHEFAAIALVCYVVLSCVVMCVMCCDVLMLCLAFVSFVRE